MTDLKNKVVPIREHLVKPETVDKVGHATTEAVQQVDATIFNIANKAKELAVETADKVKAARNKIVGKPQTPSKPRGTKSKARGTR